MSTFSRRPNYGDDPEFDAYIESRIDPEWTGRDTDHYGWESNREQARYERDRGAADNFWLVLGSGAVALGALTFLFPILVWPLVVFAAVWMVVAVVSIPFALWLGRRIGGAR